MVVFPSEELPEAHTLGPKELVKLRYDLAIDLYRQRARARAVQSAKNSGRSLEYWAYKVFEYTPWLDSLALTLNPFWQLDKDLRHDSNHILPGIYPQSPYPANRTRYRIVVPSLIISSRRKRTSTVQGVSYEFRIPAFEWVPIPYGPLTDLHTDDSSAIAQQYTIRGWIKDTTFLSRNPRLVKLPKKLRDQIVAGVQSQGEAEIWKPNFSSASHGLVGTSTVHNYQDNNPDVGIPYSVNTITDSWALMGASATVDVSDVDAIPAKEKEHALLLLKEKSISMVAQCLPTRRAFNLIYNVAELKDLPQALRGTLAVWKDIESAIGRDEWSKALTKATWWTERRVLKIAPHAARVGIFLRLDKELSDAYLTFLFGWQSFYQAVDQLVNAPSKVTKDINNLLKHNGKLIRLSTTQNLPVENWTAFPSIKPLVPNGMIADPLNPTSQSGTRKIKLRCVVESGVQLPPVDIPILRKQLYYDKLGFVPRPSDIYNLIPWTWLIDWFAGVAQYIRLAEEVQGDKQLINWAMMTYHSDLSSEASRGAYVITSESTNYSLHPFEGHTSERRHDFTGSGKFSASYYLRVDVASLANVKTKSGFHLSDTQKAILQALFTKFL